MAKKRSGWEMMVYYGTAGSTASTLIDKNIEDVDPGTGDYDFADMPSRGDGTNLPQTDERPVMCKAAPKFSMHFKDSETHVLAMLAAADAETPTPKAFKFLRYSGGIVAFDGDCYIKYSAPGPIKEGQKIDFELHPTSDGGRAWTAANT